MDPELLDGSGLMLILRQRGLYPYLATDGQPRLHGNPALVTPKLRAVLALRRDELIAMLRAERNAENIRPVVYLDPKGAGVTVPSPLLVPKEATYWQYIGESDWRMRVDLPHLKEDAPNGEGGGDEPRKGRRRAKRDAADSQDPWLF